MINRILRSLLGTALSLLFLTNCATKTGLDAPGDIPYLAGIGVDPTPSPSVVNPAMADAHWDGDGVPGSPKIVIDLSDQMASFYKSGQLVGVSPVSTGTSSHPTPTGHFKVTQKNIDHRSSCYGDYVDAAGNVVKKDIDNRKDPRPPGTRYLGADMGYFMRFNGPIGMHRGFLPGYPASHGCVRLPETMAKAYFENAPLGTPVIVQH